MISALRGLCPRPLDECGIEAATLRPAGRDDIRPDGSAPSRFAAARRRLDGSSDRPGSERLKPVRFQESSDTVGHLLEARLPYHQSVVGMGPEGLVYAA